MKGKILTISGYFPDILELVKVTLFGRDSLVLLETSTGIYKESIIVVLSDKLRLLVDVRFRSRLNNDKKILIVI